MKKSTQRIIYTVIIMVVLAIVVVYAYFQRVNGPKETTPKTKMEKMINRNLEGNYPATPREVVKVYGELTKYLYNGDEEEKMTQEKFEALFDQVRVLYAEELLTENPREEQLVRLAADVKDYKKNSRTIMSYSVQKTSQIKFGKLNGENVAKVVIIFTTKATGEQPARTYEEVLLKEDGQERWKIMGWQQVSGEGIEGE